MLIKKMSGIPYSNSLILKSLGRQIFEEVFRAYIFKILHIFVKAEKLFSNRSDLINYLLGILLSKQNSLILTTFNLNTNKIIYKPLPFINASFF